MLTHSENIFSLDRQTKLRRTNFKIKAHQITERIQLDIVCVLFSFFLTSSREISLTMFVLKLKLKFMNPP